ncbi:proteasome subunit beta [Candidatus Bathyarchaeota archaeon ex4484_40]|nr:MAG: proteasome subunit beta [Candidatus Bathyarchaeota archaeon ex4484_40]
MDEYSYVPGATTVGAVFGEGVILASEKRVVYRSYILSRNAKKVFKINERIGMACAGLISGMQYLLGELKSKVYLFELETRRQISVKSTARLLSNMLFEERGRFATEILIGGVDVSGAKLYIIDRFGSVIPDNYAAVGSGAQIAIGVLEEGYKKEMSIEEAKELVIKSVRSAASRDAMSGNGIDVLTITSNGALENTFEI